MDDPLIEAAWGDDSRELRQLLREGIEPERREAAGAALYVAAGNPAKLKLLLEAGADPDTEGPEGTPLCFAACWGEAECVGLLLAHGADPDYVEQRDTPAPGTALMLA
ncbi:MAG TPA: ankyrin repeat domain-containing protein, partial [Gaiellaceae bacterium]|nr:ankyrin repeat domain-containing protein [Gaiellaceae bacterium]